MFPHTRVVRRTFVPDHTPAQPTEPPTGPSTPTDGPAPTGAVRVARIGGTIAELAAAAISAHTLYHLGGQLDLGPATAWLLPAALDVYAFTALAIGYNLPAHHPGQKPVLRNARLAFAMTLGCNCLDHFLAKAGRLVDPTIRDLLLVAVATLPPLVVERLLNLQSLLVGGRAAPARPVATQPSDPLGVGRAVGQGTLARNPDPDQPLAADHPQTRPEPTDHQAPIKTIARLDWTLLGTPVFAELSARLGRRPSAREFQAALAAEVRIQSAHGRLAANVRPPSVTTAKRVRAALEIATASHVRKPGEPVHQASEPSKEKAYV
jgi:hypothetical protein